MSERVIDSCALAALPFTGERFTPECSGEIWLEHWHRYLFAAKFCTGKRVLDVACGEGYGSAFLATVAGRVTGADIDSEAISHAKSRYTEVESLEFIQASATQLPLTAGSVDVLVSFETIEHLKEQAEMLAEFSRVLAPQGVLILSSPNRPLYSDAQNYSNPYHVRELDRDELAELLAPHFPSILWFGQRLNFQSSVWSEDGCASGGEVMAVQRDNGEPSKTRLDAMYYLVVAAREGATLPDLPLLSALVDNSQSLYQKFRSYYLMAMHQRDEIASLHNRVEELLAKNEIAQAALPNLPSINDDELRSIKQALESTQRRLEYRESWRGWLRFPAHRLRLLLGATVGPDQQ
jgi:SAM-dependent methyltransferase